MRRSLWGVGVIVTAVVVIWTLRPPKATVGSAAPVAAKDAVAPADRSAPNAAPARSSDSPARPAARGRRISKEEHVELRRRIAESLEARAAAPKATAPREAPENNAPTNSDLRDRTDGTLTKFMGTINEDFMPLADECFEAARGTDPNLRGLLDLEFSIMADAEIGGLVDSVALGDGNEIQDPQLTECIRETMLSTVFPAPEGTGQTEVRLTIPLEPEAP